MAKAEDSSVDDKRPVYHLLSWLRCVQPCFSNHSLLPLIHNKGNNLFNMYRAFWSHTQHDGFLLLLLLLGRGKEKTVGMGQQIVAKVSAIIFVVKCYILLSYGLWRPWVKRNSVVLKSSGLHIGRSFHLHTQSYISHRFFTKHDR